MTGLTPESKNVWIKDIYHPHYPSFVKIKEVIDGGYVAQIQTAVGKNVSDGPIEFFKEDQLTNSVMGD